MDGKVVILEGNEEDEKIKEKSGRIIRGKFSGEILKDYKSPVVPGLPPYTGGPWDIFHMITSNMGNHH